MNPDDFTPDGFDLLTAVVEKADKYRGDEQIDIRGVPAYNRTALRRWLAWAEERGDQVNKGAAIACAAVHGLHRLEATEEVRKWKEIAKRAKVLENVSGRAQVMLDEQIHGHRFELPDPMQAGRCRLVFRCSDSARKELFGAADRVFGLAASSLTLVCFVSTLSSQPGFNRDLAQYMRDGFQAFLNELSERTTDLRITVEVLEKKEGH